MEKVSEAAGGFLSEIGPSKQALPSVKGQAQAPTWKALAALKAKAELEPFEYTPAPLKDDEVTIRVTHNGVCHSDLHMKDNYWGITTFPLIPGHEVVGMVEEVGSAVKDISVGDRVGFGWIASSCGRCNRCIAGMENLCDKGYQGLIVGRHGGFQERLRGPGHFAYKIPEALDSASAAPLLCAGLTVFAPIRRYVRAGMKVGVIGLGGLGHLAVQFCRAFGAATYLLTPFTDQRADAKRFGALDLLDTSREKDLLLTQKGTFDVILNTAPVKLNWDLYVDLLRNDGKLVLIGIPASKVEVDVAKLVFGQKSIVGSIVGGRLDMAEMLEVASIHHIWPQIELMPLADANIALERVRKGQANYRIVLASP